MKIKVVDHRMRALRALVTCAALCGITGPSWPQSLPLTIQKNDSRVSISWTSSLGLVQPQKATSLAAGAWQDFGAATTASILVETAAGGGAFYRLRFLAPNITVQPQSHSVPAGGNAAFFIIATGTFPFAYQWRRSGTNLSQQSSPTLVWTNVNALDAGDYTVVVNNSVGSVTSLVAVLAVPVSVAPARGIFMGGFAGQTNGGFAMMIRSNGQGAALFHSVAQAEGVLITNLLVGSDASFAAIGTQNGKLAGTAAGDTASGTLVGTNGIAGAFSGTSKSETGSHAADAGFYSGTFGGLLSGSAYFILAADGTAFTYLTSPTIGGGGTFGKIDAANKFATTVAYTIPGATGPTLIQIGGTLNPTTHQFSGDYSVPGITLGTFSITRIATP